ncbi:hypothetical protein Tco_0105948 [Tanacetum coccineum]
MLTFLREWIQVAVPDTKTPWGGAPAQTRSERVLKQPNEPPLPEGHTSRSGEGRMEYTFELMDIVPPTPHDSPLPGCYTPRSDEDPQTKEKSQEIRKIEEVKHITPKKEDIQADSDFDRLDDDMENVEGETVYAATSVVSTTGALVSTARPTVSIVGPSTSAVGTSTDTRDKGKGIMVEPDPPVKIKRSDQGDLQLQADAELAQLLHQEELAQVERRQRERAAQEEASIAALYEEYDTIQASIDADALFAARLQQEEREQFTIEERAQFLVETIAAQRKFRAAQRAAEIRSKPPTKTQLRNMMITYLKNMGKFNHNQLKGKSYEELQRLYEREQKWINDFVPMDSEKEEKKSVEPESVGKKGKRIKRVADSALKQKSSKKQKMMQEQESAKSDEDAAADYEHEKEELRMWLTVVPDEEETMDLF